MPRHSGLPKLVPAQGGGPKDNPTTNTSSQHTKAPLRPPALPNTPSRLGGPPAPVRAELLRRGGVAGSVAQVGRLC